ncbi:hypothetical protein Tco_0642050 [Tanacetum coccineum]
MHAWDKAPKRLPYGLFVVAGLSWHPRKIAVGEGYTSPVFEVKEIDHGEEEVPYWTTHARLPKGGDSVWHIRMELIDPDGKKFKRVFRTMSITRKLSEKNKPSDILDLDHLYDS